MKVRAAATGLLLLGMGLAAGHAQPAREAVPQAKLVGYSPRTAARMATAQARVEQQQWADAVAEYQSILDEAGDDWIPADPKNPDHCVCVRRLVQQRLAALPAAGLRAYRARFDEPAQKWLDQAGHDAALLRRLTDQAYCSRPAETAIDLLGDLAFARGAFREAERWWLMLARPASEAGAARPVGAGALRLAYPDPQSDPALIRAKLILAAYFLGDRQRAADELTAFRAAHPAAGGLLAGRKGPYADTLQALITRPLGSTGPPEDWPTFAGDASRNGTAGRLPKIRWLEETWRVRMDGQAAPAGAPAPPAKVRNAGEAAQALAFFPVIAGDRVIIADSRFVTVFDLLTGKRLGRFDLVEQQGALPALENPVPVTRGQRYCLTVDGDRVYARLGATAMTAPPEQRNGNAADIPAETFLVCLRVAPDGRLSSQWMVPVVAAGEKVPAAFEGAPLVHAGRVYAARTAFTTTASLTQLESYDAATGSRLWRQDVAAAPETADGDKPRHRQHLLTLAENHVVYCTHAGAVVAVDAGSGRRAWATRYPRRVERALAGRPIPRDLTPPLYAAGRVYVAPADADRIYCLDAATGRTLWESKPVEVVHLLGVVAGRLIFTTGDRPRGIRGLDAVTGADVRQWMHPEGGHGELPSMGRGLFAGSRLLWPTSEGLRILKEDGQVADEDFVPLQGIGAGNLAVGNGAVIVATDRELIGYVSPARELEQRKKAAAAEPKSPAAAFRLAVAEADAGLYRGAARSFQDAGNRVNEAKNWRDERSFREQGAFRDLAFRLGNFDMTLAQADVELAQGNSDWLATAREATRSQYPLWRARGWSAVAGLAERAGKPADAVGAWDALVGHPHNRHVLLHDVQGHPQRAAYLAAAQVERLKEQNGPGIAAGIAKASLDLLTYLIKERPEESENQLLVEVLERYPNAAPQRASVGKLAMLAMADRRYEIAAELNRALLRSAADPAGEIRALAGLALAYEGMSDWKAARATWEHLARSHGEEPFPPPAVRLRVREHVAQQLEKPGYRAGSEGTRLSLSLPLRRVWEGRHAGEIVGTKGAGETLGMAFTLSYIGYDRSSVYQSLACLHAESGQERWSWSLDPGAWVRCHADTAVVADRCKLGQLRLSDGKLLWALVESDEAGQEWGHFQIAAGRVFFLSGQRQLLCVDVESGQVLWDHWAHAARSRPAPPAGRFQPWYHAGSERLLMQSSLGHPLLLDSLTGKELPCGLRTGLWLRPPVVLDGRQVCLVPDNRHVVLFDLRAGKEVWTHTIEGPTSLAGAPQLLAAGDTLLLGVPRNFGHELIRLDPATGKPTWAAPVRLRHDAVDLANAATDESAVYLAAGHVLEAIRLTEGKRLWDRPLGAAEGGWRVTAAKNALLVQPLRAQPDIDVPGLLKRWLALDAAATVPTMLPCSVGRAAAGAALRVRREQAPSRFALLVCDPTDGQLLQRLNFVGRGTNVGVQLTPHGIVVGTAGAAWGLQ